tara:strand:- start:13036 stop:15207 length:2172 start_codon:yes stop_codon:yes gene_type:complete
LNAHSLRQTGPKQAVAFLRALDPTGRHNLVAIDPSTGHVDGQTFEPGDWIHIETWVAAREGTRNLYASVNEPAAGAPNDKLKKEHIGAIRALFADLDPAGKADLDTERAEIAHKVETLQHSVAPPTFSIDSGSGSQFVWKLEEKLPPVLHGDPMWRQWAEDQGRALRHMIGGDAVQNIDRIMRLPGTMNLPTAKKAAKGRIPRASTVTHATDRQWTPEAISAAVRPIKAAEADTETDAAIAAAMQSLDMETIRSSNSLEDLDGPLRSRFLSAVADDRALAALWSGEPPKDDSGSGYRCELAKHLGRHGGFNVADYAALAWVWEHATQPGDDREQKLTRRSLARDWHRIGAKHDLAAKYWEELDEQPPSSDQNLPKRFSFTTLGEAAASALTAGAKPLVKGLLDQGAMTVLYGESNSGKTFVAMDLAFHIAAGRSWAGMKVAPGGVVYVAAEGGAGARKRAAALLAKYGGDDVPFRFLLSPVNLLRADADLQPLGDSINEVGGTTLVVIDTLSRAMAGGDENASTDMGAMVRNLDALRAGVGAHLLVVHHSGKDKARGARGHSLLRAATDTEIEIADKVISVTKQRDIDGSFSSAFDLDVVTLGADSEGDPVTSCTVRLLSRADAPVGKATPKEGEIVTAVSGLSVLLDDESKGVALADLVEEMAGRDDPMAAGTVKFHVKALIDKRILVKAGRGRYVLNGQCVGSESKENDPNFGPGGQSVFD